jgi:LysR family transcriptional regulator, glycine cleavage system transcriptional activator
MNKSNSSMQIRAARRGLPGLKALRAFEAVAFHGSFTQAADELAVSQGAVSHQIKQIEDNLGVLLFHRSARGVSLTPQGLLLREAAEQAFDKIGEVVSLIRADRKTQILRVRAGPFFAMKVIAPSISEFMKANPGVQLHLNNLRDGTIMPRSDDVFIEYGVNAPSGVFSVVILHEELVPVCSPSLLESDGGSGRLLMEASIARLNYRDLEDWEKWLEMAGLEAEGGHPNLVFDDQHTIIEAARAGLGIALADRALIQEDVARGRICVLSERFIQPRACYRLVCAEENVATKSCVAMFHEWLVQEITKIQKTAVTEHR